MARTTKAQSQVESYQDSKKVLHASLINTQYYKLGIKGKVDQSREWSSALSYSSVLVAIEKGAFASPSTLVANFTYK